MASNKLTTSPAIAQPEPVVVFYGAPMSGGTRPKCLPAAGKGNHFDLCSDLHEALEGRNVQGLILMRGHIAYKKNWRDSQPKRLKFCPFCCVALP